MNKILKKSNILLFNFLNHLFITMFLLLRKTISFKTLYLLKNEIMLNAYISI